MNHKVTELNLEKFDDIIKKKGFFDKLFKFLNQIELQFDELDLDESLLNNEFNKEDIKNWRIIIYQNRNFFTEKKYLKKRILL